MTTVASPILIVDDNEANLKVARIALETEGFEVGIAANGEEALEIVRTFHPRLILMDIQLPGLDGLEVTRRLKADVATREIVVIAVTAYAMKGDREKALGAGCDGYIAKPLDPIQLPIQVTEFLGEAVETLPPRGDATAELVVIETAQAPPQAIAQDYILLVEDNPTTRKMFRIALEAAGHHVIEAFDARTALSIARRATPALVVQDLILPDMDGLELARNLRQQFADRPVPILCVSGFLSRLDEARTMVGGFAQVLVKPVDPMQLIDAVRVHLAVPPDATRLGEGRRILIVDDDPLQRRLAQVWFSGAGFDVITADDGVAGLEVAHRARPDVIVSDVLMPGIDGYGLCLAARRDGELGQTPVILNSSAYVEAADHALAARVGASALLAKSEGLEAVIQAVSAALSAPPPPVPCEPLELLEGEHARRALWQLERQVQQNARLLQRTTLQEAQLAVLAGVAESLAKNQVLNGVLGDVLAACLDMAGISKGALYTIAPTGSFALEHQIGFSESEVARLRAILGAEAEFLDLARRGAVVLVPSLAVPPDLAQRLIIDAGATSLLLVPVTWASTTFGMMILAARTADIRGEDALAFARVLGAQMGQAIGLARSFVNLAASELRYRTLTENANDAICILTPDGVIREANRRLAEILGQPPDQLTGRRLEDFVTRGRAPTDAPANGAPVVTDQERASPDEVRRPDGSVVLIEFSRTSVEVSGERLVFTIGRDVTAQVEAQARRAQLEDEQRRIHEELLRREFEATEARAARQVAEAKAALVGELERRNKELEAFSYSVSHDLRAPLRSIAGFSHALLTDTALDETGQEYLQHIASAAQRMAELIDDLLELSRVSLAKLQREEVNVSVMARTVLADLRYRDAARTVASTVQDDLVVDADPRLVRVVLENLIGNAWKFTARTTQPCIELGAIRDGDGGTAYFVRDNGAGFDMAYADKLFAPFQRLHGEAEFPGTGIGLTTVHRIVERHGGRVWAVGAVGQGASVFFTLSPGRGRPAMATAVATPGGCGAR